VLPLIWFLGGFPLDPTQLYFFSAEHESQRVFNVFQFRGVILDKTFTAEVSEGFHIQHSLPDSLGPQYAT
jgi:hypothetical protein